MNSVIFIYNHIKKYAIKIFITLDKVNHFADAVDLQPVSFDVGDGNFVPGTGKTFNLVVQVTSAASTVLGPFQSRLHLSDEPTLKSAKKLPVRPNAHHIMIAPFTFLLKRGMLNFTMGWIFF